MQYCMQYWTQIFFIRHFLTYIFFYQTFFGTNIFEQKYQQQKTITTNTILMGLDTIEINLVIHHLLKILISFL